ERGCDQVGEAAGRQWCRRHTTTGDGFIAALQVLRALRMSGKSPAEACGGMNKCPQELINVRYQSNGGSPLDAPELREVVAATEARLADTGRVLLRLSGTEPVIRVMVEGQNAAQVNQEAEALAAVVRKMFAAD